MYGQTNCGGAWWREHCAAGRGTGGSEADGSLGASDDARCYAWLGQRSKCLGIRCRASECLGDGRITRDSA